MVARADGVLVVVGGGVLSHLSLATSTTADYPDNKVTLPPATTGRPVRTQAIQGSPRKRGAWG